MPGFTYKAKDKSGQRVEGSLEASDRMAALKQVEKLGLIPVSIATAAGGGKASPSPKAKETTKIAQTIAIEKNAGGESGPPYRLNGAASFLEKSLLFFSSSG